MIVCLREQLVGVLQDARADDDQDVLDFGRLAELLGYDRKLNTLDFPVAPRGYRVLGRVPRIPKLVVQKITHELGGLEEVIAASDADLAAVDGVFCVPQCAFEAFESSDFGATNLAVFGQVSFDLNERLALTASIFGVAIALVAIGLLPAEVAFTAAAVLLTVLVGGVGAAPSGARGGL